jgi:GT2 family glycosyltransferase
MTLPSHRSDLPPRSEEDQRAFFALALAQTRVAEDVAGTIDRDIMLLGRRVRLRFAGPALEPLLFPALAHKQVAPEGAPDLLLHIWDSASSGVRMPPAPVSRHCFSDRGDIWTFHSRQVRSAFHWSEYSLNLLDTGAGEGIFWVPGPDNLPFWTQASPFRTLLHWWAQTNGAQLVHAAAIGTGDGAILVTGRGGVGKSSIALGCIEAGFSYVGDDYVVLTGGDRVRAHNLYRTAKLNPEDQPRFRHFGPRLIGTPQADAPQKAVIFLETGLVDTLDIDLVATPRFAAEAETRFESVDTAQLLGAAAYTTMVQLPHADQQTADFITAQLMRLPQWRIALGNDRGLIAPAIAARIKDPGRPGATSAEVRALEEAPLISVVIPVYNGASFLPEAIDSILAQAYPKVEIIVVDDGSTDAIAEAVAALPAEVRFLRKGNAGPAAARNLGIRAAGGSLIAFLDVDDLWPAGALGAALAWLSERPDTDVVIGRAQLCERRADARYDFVGSPGDGFTYYIGAGLYRRHAFEKIGLFDPLLRFAEDLDWYARAERGGLCVDRLDMVTLHVRRHATNSTRGMDGIALNPLRLARNALAAKRSAESA